MTRAQTVPSFVDNPDGTVTAFAANTQRIAPGVGLLIEEARTNLLQSDNLSNAAWTLFTTGSGTASRNRKCQDRPRRGKSATLLTLNRSAVADSALVFQGFTASATVYTGSVYVKAATNADIGQSVSIAYDPAGSPPNALF